MKKSFNKLISFFNKYELIRFDKNNKVIIVLAIFIAFGMVCGALCVGTVNMEFLHKLDFLFLNDFKERIGCSGLDIFISSFFSILVFALIIEVTALSFWGAVVIPLLVTFRGLGLGIVAGYLYLIYGLKGIAFYILILLPGIFISSIGIVIFAAESFKFSCKFANKILPKSDNEYLWSEFKVHIKKISYALIILLVSSVIDMSFLALFSRFFEF